MVLSLPVIVHCRLLEERDGETVKQLLMPDSISVPSS
jgi:hypothetical protein